MIRSPDERSDIRGVSPHIAKLMRATCYVMPRSKGVESPARICYDVAMERDEAISRLRQHEADLKRLGVEHLYMFGSMARGEAKHDSDVDLFFDYEKGKLGVYELMDVKEYAASILGRKTEIMTRDSLHKALRDTIEATAVRVF
ncbi:MULTISPECIES: nucleotidyltransferase domain-containing protein [unclassified Bradyrhizobium]|uniref:nucleotidyltransferase family protein n=1 Tax=unclassified Bradyrhizobium TaxID=2631580 RepID=UPI0028A0F7E7|nr:MULTISPECIES: nucleotidyltransferase domain-containing protein [unclassified Bradyrhizobium]